MIVIRYPPDFDGELHITTKEEHFGNKAVFKNCSYSFTLSLTKDETQWQGLVRVARDIIAQNLRIQQQE